MKILLKMIAFFTLCNNAFAMRVNPLPAHVEQAVKKHYFIGRTLWDCCGISNVQSFKLDLKDAELVDVLKNIVINSNKQALSSTQYICDKLNEQDCLDRIEFFAMEVNWKIALSEYGFDGDKEYFEAFRTIETYIANNTSDSAQTIKLCYRNTQKDICDTVIVDSETQKLFIIAHDYGN